MSKGYWLLKIFKTIGLVLILGMSMSACALGGGASWKEEVLLHDGSKIIATRSQTRGGSHEVAQPSSVKEHTITFKVPNSSEILTFKSEYGEDLGRANFNLLALHILNGTPYLVVEPNLCFSYNKWGRPNPPYIFFKYDDKTWQRIPLSDFPAEFKNFNLIINNGQEDQIEKVASKLGYVSVDGVQAFNSSLTQPQYKNILREPYPYAARGCMELVPYGKGGWLGLDWFRNQPTFEVCSKFCEIKSVSPGSCPCETLFKGK